MTNKVLRYSLHPVHLILRRRKDEHFSEVFEKTDAEAALAAGIFHRKEVSIETVKEHMRKRGIETR